MSVTKFSATTLALAAIIAGPALAQTASTTAPGTPPPAGSTMAPSADASNSGAGGSLTKSHGDFRSSQLVGATVYNDQSNSIGTVDNLLVDGTGRVSQAVISVGGFLGVGSKLVAVPFSQLKFEPSRTSGTADATRKATNAVTPSSMHVASDANDYSVVLPGASKNSLTGMPTFTYGS